MPEVDELRTILESGDITALFSSEELREHPRLSSSLVDLPTFLQNDEPLPNEVIDALSHNKAAYKIILDHFPNSVIAQSLEDNRNMKSSQDVAKIDNNNENLLKPPEQNNVIKLKRKVSSLFKTKPLRPILKKPSGNAAEQPNGSATAVDDFKVQVEDEQNQLLTGNGTLKSQPPDGDKPPSFYLNHLRVRKQSLTYRGAMLSIPKYRLRASSCPDIYRNSMTTIATIEEESDSCCQRTISGNFDKMKYGQYRRE